MGTMNISLPDALKSFVDEQVEKRGYGTSSDYGGKSDRLLGMLQAIKRTGVRIPLIELAYLAAILRAQGFSEALTQIFFVCNTPVRDLTRRYGVF